MTAATAPLLSAPPAAGPWPAPAEHPAIPAAGELHLWSVDLLPLPDAREERWRALTRDDRERAARFRFARHRDRFAAARGALRLLLSRYLGEPPARLRLVAGPHGKPALSGPDPALHFNLSHAGDLALLAVGTTAPVGVDVEPLRDAPDLLAVADRFFSPAEVRLLHTLPLPRRVQGFFHCWTCKEAVIKATGEGLSRPLHSFDVAFLPAAPATRLLRLEGDPQAPHRWHLEALHPAPGYVGAVACTAPVSALRPLRMR